MGRSVARALLLGLLCAALPALPRASSTSQDPEQQQQQDEDAGRSTSPSNRSSSSSSSTITTSSRAGRVGGMVLGVLPVDGRCAVGDEDCSQQDLISVTPGDADLDPGSRRINNYLHGRPLVPDEGDGGFLYARSVSFSLDEDVPREPGKDTTRRRALKSRVFGQTWCSASVCPVSAALTLSNGTTKLTARKIGQGEAVVACLDCTFSAASVSILDGEAVCATASSTNMPRGVCTALCWWDAGENRSCTCESGCSSNELGSESVHTYDYRVTADTSMRDLLSYLHRLLVRLHNAGEHLNIASILDVATKTRTIRRNVERRFGRDKAKAVPLLHYDNWGGIS